MLNDSHGRYVEATTKRLGEDRVFFGAFFGFIENPESIACLDKCGLDSGKLLTLLEHVKNFSSKWNETLYCNHDENPSELIKKWVGLLEEDKEEQNKGLVNEVNSLYRRTEKFLRSLLTIPHKEKAV